MYTNWFLSLRNLVKTFIIIIGVFGYGQEDPFNCDYNAYLFQYNDIYALEFNANGTGELEITIIKKSINEWENQFKTSISLNDTDNHFVIPLEYFTSKTVNNIDLNDAVSIVFTMSSNGTDVETKKMNLKDILFSQRALSVNDNIIEENESIIYPNPMTNKSEISFYSEVNANTNIEVYSLTGALVRKIEIDTQIGNNKVEIFKDGLKSGLYILKVSNDYRKYNTKKLIVN